MHEYLTNRGYRAILNASLLSGIGDSLYNIVHHLCRNYAIQKSGGDVSRHGNQRADHAVAFNWESGRSDTC